ncbi:signal peptidase I [Agromyces arachidis]|uniref:signal peptidase I n=1 Tax=Agromyces arachidis TaxID=766966 RepID=UPI00405727ED
MAPTVLRPEGAPVLTVVRSDAMRPALHPGDVLLASRVRGAARPRRGEILVYRVPDQAGTRIRRVIGLPGDRVRIDDGGATWVNDHQLFEPYARRSAGFHGSFGVPDDRYFALSDLRERLHEPRAWRESFVPTGDVVGVARMRVFPWPIAATGVLAR